MRKARFMLVAVCIVAGISGVTSFKAMEKLGSVIYEATTAHNQACITIPNLTLTPNPFPVRTGYFTTSRCDIVHTTRMAYSQQ